MNNKIIMIVGIVLIVISIGLSAFSVLMLKGVTDQINGDGSMSAEIEEEMAMVPIAQQSIYEMTDSIIATYQNEVEGESAGTLNVSVRIGFGLYADEEDKDGEQGVTDMVVLLGESEGFLTDRISKLLSAKDYAYMNQDGIEDVIQQEILEMVQFELETKYIIQVYFPDGLLTSYR